jgi:uncharacterized protein YndB with AHSA1/START domain
MSAGTITPAPVRKSLIVKADPHKAFAAFTRRMGNWWPRSHHIGTGTLADVVLEPRAGGRWFERDEDGSECEWGRVLAWEPPGRVVLAWQLGSDWKYDPTLVTEIEVTFTAVSANETQVLLEHRNLERFGDAASAVREAIDSPGGWAGILAAFGVAAAQ